MVEMFARIHIVANDPADPRTHIDLTMFTAEVVNFSSQ